MSAVSVYQVMKALFFPFVLLIILTCTSCGSGQQEQIPEVDTVDYKNSLMNVNQTLVERENRQIDNYIQRKGWDMIKTGTGLRYEIYLKTQGTRPQKDMTAQIRFRVNLISGQVVYDSKTDGLKSFRLGQDEVENGLEEGIMLMKKGEKARLVIPSHLAFGLLGDDNKIPKRATLVYDVELLEVF